MDFKANIVPKKESNKDVNIRATYDSVRKKWYAKFGDEKHPISKHSLEISGAKILYSLPSNDAHPKWTRKDVTNIQNPFLVSKEWSVLREGIALIGKPNKRDNSWEITKILHNNIKE